MTRTIIINDSEFQAFDWTEATPILHADDSAPEKHIRDENLIGTQIEELAPGEVYFHCDQTFAFDTTLTLKGDNRKFVIIAGEDGRHIAKPY